MYAFERKSEVLKYAIQMRWKTQKSEMFTIEVVIFVRANWPQYYIR